MNDLVVREEGRMQVDLFSNTPKDLVEHAAVIANVLKDVIEKQNFVINISGNRYVKVDGWATLGSMVGILPRENKVIRHEDGSYEASVSLINVKTGYEVGQGSAICAMDEVWAKRPEYARRSMAITRATGKAYRIGLGWIMKFAGYESTPAEEMDGVVVVARKDIFTGAKDQKEKLKKYLTNKKVNEKYYEKIFDLMMGQKPDQIDQAIKEAIDE